MDLVKNTEQKMMFSIKNFFIKCEKIRTKLDIWSQLLKKSFMENVSFCAVETNPISPIILNINKKFQTVPQN